MDLFDVPVDIRNKYPELPGTGKRAKYGYTYSKDKKTLLPVYEILIPLEEVFLALNNGATLTEGVELLNASVPPNKTLTVMGLKHVRDHYRPNDKPIKKGSPGRKVRPKDDAARLEEKRKKALASERRKLSWQQKKVSKIEQDLEILEENKKTESKPFFELPQDHEILVEETLPEGLEEEKIIFKPSAKQVKFLAASEQEVLYGGAAGGGKSYALLADAARYFEFPSFNGLLLRRTIEELRELIWESLTLYKQLYPKAKWKEQDKTWIFPSGARLWMSYLEQDKDVLRYQGQAFTWIGFDELTQHPTPFAWNFLRSRLRTKDEALKPFLSMRATTNPGGPGHGWVKRMFIDPSPVNTPFPAQDVETGEVFLVPDNDPDFPPERWGKPLFYRKFIPATLTDNPYLGHEYKANLLSMPEGQRRQLLFGDWTLADGAAFPEFSRAVHTCTPFDIPNTWRKFRSCDYGYSAKSASAVHWYAVSPDNTIYVYRELYVKGYTARDLAKEVLEWERGENITYGILDSSCWHQRGHNGPSIAEEMIRVGCRWRPSDRTDGSRKAGKNRLHELLKVDEYSGTPGILFFDNCRQIISDLEVIPIHPAGKDDIDDKYSEDHAYDSIRYGVMSRPRQSTVYETYNRGVTYSSYKPSDPVFGY